MTTRYLYCIWDILAADYAGPPFTEAHDKVAIRQFMDSATQSPVVSRHIKDFRLERLAELTPAGVTPSREIIFTGEQLQIMLDKQAEEKK